VTYFWDTTLAYLAVITGHGAFKMTY
jgi:hypothetical protein